MTTIAVFALMFAAGYITRIVVSSVWRWADDFMWTRMERRYDAERTATAAKSR